VSATKERPAVEDPVIWRAELPGLLHIGTEAVRRHIKAGKLPPPDVDLSRKTRGWKLSTLRAAGINL
jgi:hypothetical protein